MSYKYSLLKRGWGIVIYIDIEIDNNKDRIDYDILKIQENIVLLLHKNIIKLLDQEICWLKQGINDFYNYFSNIFQSKNEHIIYLNSLVFNECHFQEEGLYVAIQEALGKYYDVQIPITNVVFDKDKNKYIFDIPN